MPVPKHPLSLNPSAGAGKGICLTSPPISFLHFLFAVALGMQPIHPGVPQNPVLTKGNQRPLLGDLLPAQGHVVVEDPAPQIRLDSEKQKKLAPVSMEQSQSTVELQIEVKPKVVVEQEGEVKTEAKKEPEVKAEPQTKPDSDVKAEPEVKVEPEVKAEPEAEAEPEVKVEHELNSEPEVMAELEANVESLVEMEELEDNPDFKVESEVKADPGVQEETEDEVKLVFNEDPEFQEVQEKFQVQMNLEEETEHREFDMQEKYEMVDEPIMELEPLDDDNDELNNMELSEARKSVRAAFQNEEPVNEPLPEDEALMRRRDYVLEEEPIMESEMEQEQVVEDAASMEEGPALDITGQQMPLLEEIFPNEEARMGMMGMEPDTLSNYTLMKEPRSEFVGEEELSPASLSFEEPAMEDSPALDGGVQPGVVPIREKKAMMRQGLRAPVEEGLEQGKV